MGFPEISLFNTKIATLKNNQTSYQTPSITYKNSQTDTFESKNNKTFSKKPWYIAGGIALLGAAAYVINCIRKPSQAKQAQKLVKQLIKQLKPKDVELAKEFYPVIHKNAQNLKLKPENYNTIMSCLNKENKEFMLQEGIDLISSKYEKLKEVLAEPVEDICNLIKSLNKKNTPIFNTVTSDIKKFQILDVEDVTKYLTELNPEKYDYMFNKLMPKISENSEALQLSMVHRIIKTLNHITPETEDLLPRLAKKYPNEGKINKYTVLINSTKDNKECAVSFVKNSGKLGLGTDGIVTRMKTMTNDNAKSIDMVSDNIDFLKELLKKEHDPSEKIDFSNLFKLPNYQATAINEALKKPDLYRINYFSDINAFTELNPKQVEFMQALVMPKLEKYGKDLKIEDAFDIRHIVRHLNPKTVDSMDIVGEYAKRINAKISDISYNSIFSCINNKNYKNVENVMKTIEKNPEMYTEYRYELEKLFDISKNGK